MSTFIDIPTTNTFRRRTNVKSLPRNKLSKPVVWLIAFALILTNIIVVYLWYSVSKKDSGFLDSIADVDLEGAAFARQHQQRHKSKISATTAMKATIKEIVADANEIEKQAEQAKIADVVATAQRVVIEETIAMEKPTRASAATVARLHVDARREKVVEMFRHAWNGYKRCAWGQDELKPVTCSGQNPFGLGLTIVDALDTLWIMGLKEEFQEARDWIANSLTIRVPKTVSVFETTIRVLGGLLSAYALSEDQAFLDKAVELGDVLLTAFNADGIPQPAINLQSSQTSTPGWHRGRVILAEFGTLQLEFLTLTYYTKDVKYANVVMKVIDKIIDEQSPNMPEGLYSNFWSNSGSFKPQGNSISMGGLGDSFYEYLLKVWIYGGKKHTRLLNAYLRTTHGIHNTLIQTSADGLTYVSEAAGTSPNHRMDHLSCFSGGMLALGADSGAHDEEGEAMAKRALKTGAGLAETCLEMYRRQPSKLSPEGVQFHVGQSGFSNGGAYYISRPETVETLMYLYRITEEEKYRDMGAEILTAMDEKTRADNGFSGVKDVSRADVVLDNTMQTFLLAETFKYLYLLYSDETTIPLDKFVFNTEAHTLKIPSENDSDNPVFEALQKFL